jgi:hypothetical protein
MRCGSGISGMRRSAWRQLSGCLLLAAEFGVDLTAILLGLPLSPVAFESNENRIPHGLACQLLETAAKLTGCPRPSV